MKRRWRRWQRKRKPRPDVHPEAPCTKKERLSGPKVKEEHLLEEVTCQSSAEVKSWLYPWGRRSTGPTSSARLHGEAGSKAPESETVRVKTYMDILSTRDLGQRKTVRKEEKVPRNAT